MKKKTIYKIACCLTAGFLLCSCGKKEEALDRPYSFTERSFPVELTDSTDGYASLFASDLCVVTDESQYSPSDTTSEAAGLFDITDGQVMYSKNAFERLYPASITKVMTALLTLEHGNMDDEITLKHDINLTEDGAVISTLTKGDTVTVGQVFHTMLIKSANDCAVILAEYVAGSEAKFIDMMNERARELGATHTHFVNPNGLHNNDHYTTAYDLYLIFKEAVKHEEFVDTVSSKDYTMTYTTAKKTQINEYMQSTNYYLLNEFPVPEGVVMYGGKTGTTSMAKSCLILMTKNKKGERFFSVVLGAETKEALYSSMTRLLEKTTN